MRKVDFEKFLADYDNVLQEKKDMLEKKEIAILEEKERTEKIWAESFNNYPQTIKETLMKDVISVKEKEFDSSIDEIDSKISFFEKYVVIVKDEIIEAVEANKEIEVVSQELVIEETQKYDAFGNLILQ